MPEILKDPKAQLVIAITVIFMLTALGFYIASKFRPKSDEKTLSKDEMLTKFRGLHNQGELSDEEFKNVKSTLSRQISDEIKQESERAD